MKAKRRITLRPVARHRCLVPSGWYKKDRGPSVGQKVPKKRTQPHRQKRGPEQIFCIFSLKTNTWTDVCQEGFGKMYKHFSTVKFRHYDNTRPFNPGHSQHFPHSQLQKAFHRSLLRAFLVLLLVFNRESAQLV